MERLMTLNEETTGTIHKLAHRKEIKCPHCGHEWKHSQAAGGERIICPQCHESFIM